MELWYILLWFASIYSRCCEIVWTTQNKTTVVVLDSIDFVQTSNLHPFAEEFGSKPGERKACVFSLCSPRNPVGAVKSVDDTKEKEVCC